jgi:tetratricopeptide (TPR) repeat protein
MSQSSTITSPEEGSVESSAPPAPRAETGASAGPALAVQAGPSITRLRAELALAADSNRQARLLDDLADLEEQAGDQPSAARDYLAAYNASPTFREPLEGLVRLLERRRSLKNIGKLIEALGRAASAPDEQVRALVMRATHEADVANDLAEAKNAIRAATAVEGASATERAVAWLLLEVLAGRMGEAAARQEALHERTQFAADPTWRALLLVDCARLALALGEVDAAIGHLEQALATESHATWIACVQYEQVLRDHPGGGTTGEPSRAAAHAQTLETLASMVQEALVDEAKGDAVGVPHWMRQPERLIDAWIRAADARAHAGQLDRAASLLDRARSLVAAASATGSDWALTDAVVTNARIRVALLMGDTALGAGLAERRLETETDPGLAAALAMRVAEHAASEGDRARALQAVSRAVAADPGCLPARALQLDLLADGGDAGAFASQLEGFTDYFATDEARGRAFLLAAYVWAVQARDVAGSKGALSQAAMFGVPPATTARIGRSLAAIVGDAGWYEESTKRLLAGGGAEEETASLYLELLRSRLQRGDEDAIAGALREMGASPRTAWLAHVLEAYLPPGSRSEEAERAAAERARASLDQLATLEPDPDLGRAIALVAALRERAAGSVEAFRTRLRELALRDPADPLVGSVLADAERRAGDHAAAAGVAADVAAATNDGELGAALRLEAALERWRSGNKSGAVEEMESATESAPEAAGVALGWASWGVDPDTIEGRRAALDRAGAAGGDAAVLALERFAVEVGGGDHEAARGALGVLDEEVGGPLATATALARLVWTAASDPTALGQALERLAATGPRAAVLATSELYRLAREGGDAEQAASAARRWFEAGGQAGAALEWLTAVTAVGNAADVEPALRAVADSLQGETREALLASAALSIARAIPGEPAPLASGDSAAVRLTNLELAPPGCDPRRRALVLYELDSTLGDDAMGDAASLSGWSWFAAGDHATAAKVFEEATQARPTDIAAWEGLRACAEQLGDAQVRAQAASELGTRCHDPERGAAFHEEAALLWLDLGDQERGERALKECFARDPGRGVAFDKLFRRVRERKDNDTLLAIIARRLEATDDPTEIQKLFWEQARVLREKGDQDGALAALGHVTMLDPDHVGALALLGEINIRRGKFEEAASSLARLATLDAAPAKNRVTAGVAAVDLYENKVGKPEAALELLISLHRAGLSTLPVRERLARAAAKTGSWDEATAILEVLMKERPEAQGRIDAARLAMVIHRDRLDNPQGAAAAIVKILDESPADPEALGMFLTTNHPEAVRSRLLAAARTTLVRDLATKPLAPAVLRQLVSVAAASRDTALQQAALGVVLSVARPGAGEDQTFAHLASTKERLPQIAISPDLLRVILASGDQGPLADLFALLGPTLAEALGPGLQACGVGRRDKVDPRSGLALRNEIAAWAGAFGIPEFDLYVGGKDPLGVQGIPGEPPALVVGAGINAPLGALARARVARELLAILRGTTVARSRDDTSMAAIVVAACRLAEVRVDHPPYAVLAEIERLIGKAIARKTRKALPEICSAIAAQGSDARVWSRRALASQDRIAAVASGEPAVVIADALSVPLERVAQAAPSDGRAEELLRFVLSGQYLDLRRALGLEGGRR